MILGIGIDSVEIARFSHWHTYTRKKLLRIFSEQEIEYCLSVPIKSAERFAARFAARESLYKAISASMPEHGIPFLTLCRATTIIKKSAPFIIIDWKMHQLHTIEKASNIKIHLSLTHSKHTATALVILELLSAKTIFNQ